MHSMHSCSCSCMPELSCGTKGSGDDQVMRESWSGSHHQSISAEWSSQGLCADMMLCMSTLMQLSSQMCCVLQPCGPILYIVSLCYLSDACLPLPVLLLHPNNKKCESLQILASSTIVNMTSLLSTCVVFFLFHSLFGLLLYPLYCFFYLFLTAFIALFFLLLFVFYCLSSCICYCALYWCVCLFVSL